MTLSAKHYVDREDACRAGRMAGDQYALVVLVCIAFMCWADIINGSWTMLWVGAAVLVGFRVGLEYWMGRSWDYYNVKRLQSQSAGATAAEAIAADE